MIHEDWHTHEQQQNVRSNDAKNSHTLHAPYEFMKGQEVSITLYQETYDRAWVVSMLLAIKKAIKKLFSAPWYLSKNFICHFITTLKRFHVVIHGYTASFSIRSCFYELTSFFISRTKQIYAKTLTFSESAFKLKIKSA